MLAQSLLFLGAVVGLANTQTIDPGTVPISLRDQWCLQQQTTCPLICLQFPNSTAPSDNNCDPSTLDFSCTCDNGITPNASQWTQTIPYFECTEFNTQCQNNCHGDSTCQAACVQQHPCGAQDPFKGNATSTRAVGTASSTVSGSSTATTTGGNNVVCTGFGQCTTVAATASATSTANSKTGMSPRARALEIGQVYGLFMVVAGLLGGVAIIL